MFATGPINVPGSMLITGTTGTSALLQTGSTQGRTSTQA